MSAPNDAGTPASAERTAQVQEASGPRVSQKETPGPRTARQEVLGPRVARQQALGPRVAQQGSPEAVPVCRENLQEKDRHVTVAELPGQSETETLARGQEKVWRRWSGEIRLVKDDVSGDQDAARCEVKASVPLWSGE